MFINFAKVLPRPDLIFREQVLFATMVLPESEPSQGWAW